MNKGGGPVRAGSGRLQQSQGAAYALSVTVRHTGEKKRTSPSGKESSQFPRKRFMAQQRTSAPRTTLKAGQRKAENHPQDIERAKRKGLEVEEHDFAETDNAPKGAPKVHYVRDPQTKRNSATVSQGAVDVDVRKCQRTGQRSRMAFP